MPDGVEGLASTIVAAGEPSPAPYAMPTEYTERSPSQVLAATAQADMSVLLELWPDGKPAAFRQSAKPLASSLFSSGSPPLHPAVVRRRRGWRA